MSISNSAHNMSPSIDNFKSELENDQRSNIENQSFTEKRSSLRVELDIAGRMMREDGEEYPCHLIDISGTGAVFMAPVQPSIGEKIVFYLRDIGRIQGEVNRILDGGFSIKLIISQQRLNQMVDQVTWIINQDLEGLKDSRSHTRYVPKAPRRIKCMTADGDSIDCYVEDVSMSGIALQSRIKPEIGIMLITGATNCEVVRHSPSGFAVKFLTAPSEHLLSYYL